MEKPTNIREAAKLIGIHIPEEIVLTKHEWEDLYITLAKFKFRVLLRYYSQPDKEN